jgi:uncharacterized protein YbjT (DUF2867 family)
VKALARQESLGKPEYTSLKARGVEIVVVDLSGDLKTLTQALEGIDVVISTLVITQLAEQNNLAQAAKDVGVQRFVPSFFGPIVPARGIMRLRELVSFPQKTPPRG